MVQKPSLTNPTVRTSPPGDRLSDPIQCTKLICKIQHGKTQFWLEALRQEAEWKSLIFTLEVEQEKKSNTAALWVTLRGNQIYDFPWFCSQDRAFTCGLKKRNNIRMISVCFEIPGGLPRDIEFWGTRDLPGKATQYIMHDISTYTFTHRAATFYFLYNF